MRARTSSTAVSRTDLRLFIHKHLDVGAARHWAGIHPGACITYSCTGRKVMYALHFFLVLTRRGVVQSVLVVLVVLIRAISIL